MTTASEYRLFSESSIAQLVISPFEDRVMNANQEACRLLKSDLKTIQAQRASRLFGQDFPLLVVFTQELLDKGRGWTDKLSLQVTDTTLALETTGRCIRSGDDILVFLALQGLEELKKRRERSEADRHYSSGIGQWNRIARVFQEFERENQLILDAAGEGIYGVDSNGNTTFVNPAAERILGYSAEQMVGRNMHSMVHHSHRDGTDFPAEHCPIFGAFRDGKIHTVVDDVFWSRAGVPIDVEYTSTPIRDNGMLVGAVVIFRDVSQRKADHRRLVEALNEVEDLKTRLEQENAYLHEELSQEYRQHRILGDSAAVQRLVQQIALVAPTDATVLISGESGTGKELIARTIHEMSERSQRALIRVNCAAIPEDLFESEFFGHTKGAFTGAHTDRTGRFELADGGTLFLDEVGEIPLHLQSKLLRVLQEQQFERVGDATTRHVDVRILAATNQDLKKRVTEGVFREDLFFRLNVFPIESIPLRDRRDDIPVLAQHFLSRAAKRDKRSGLRIPMAEMAKLKAYHWPGNIRELENVIERQVILSRGGIVRFDALKSGDDPVPAKTAQTLVESLEDLEALEKQLILKTLTLCGGKVSGADGAAERLGLPPTTLASRLKRLGIQPRRTSPTALAE